MKRKWYLIWIKEYVAQQQHLPSQVLWDKCFEGNWDHSISEMETLFPELSSTKRKKKKKSTLDDIMGIKKEKKRAAAWNHCEDYNQKTWREIS